MSVRERHTGPIDFPTSRDVGQSLSAASLFVGEDRSAVPLNEVLRQPLLSHCSWQVATSPYFQFDLLSPLFGDGLLGKGLGLRRKASDTNLDMEGLDAILVYALTNTCHKPSTELLLPRRRQGTGLTSTETTTLWDCHCHCATSVP